MSEYTKAFVVGGWSEPRSYIDPLTKSICESEGSFVGEAETITLVEALKNREKINREAARRIVVTHSAGSVAIDKAGIFVALNGVEPLTLPKLIHGAKKVMTNAEIGYEAGVEHAGPADAVKELLWHPTTLAVPLRLTGFSTISKLIDMAENFSVGRVYLPRDRDEYGYGLNGEVGLAISKGIEARLLPGWHNQPMQHPLAAAREIRSALNKL